MPYYIKCFPVLVYLYNDKSNILNNLYLLAILYPIVLVLPFDMDNFLHELRIERMMEIIFSAKLYSFIPNIIMEMLLLYNTMIILHYTQLNSVAFVFGIYCVNVYYLYTVYRYLYFDGLSVSIYHEIKGENCIDKGFAILHCHSHRDATSTSYNHPLLTNHKAYSSLCLKYQYDFMSMDYNDKIEWIQQFNSFKVMYDQYLFIISILVSHIVPIIWNGYALNVENDKDIVLIENKRMGTYIGIKYIILWSNCDFLNDDGIS